MFNPFAIPREHFEETDLHESDRGLFYTGYYGTYIVVVLSLVAITKRLLKAII